MGEADWGGNWVLFWWAILSKSLIKYTVDGWVCVPSLLFDLRPNYGGGNEDNGDLLQKVPCRHCCTQCSQPCSRPPPTHVSAKDSGHSQASLGQSLVGGHCSFLLGSVHTSFCLCPPRAICLIPHVHGQRSPSKMVGIGAAVAWCWSDFEGKGEAPAKW